MLTRHHAHPTATCIYGLAETRSVARHNRTLFPCILDPAPCNVYKQIVLRGDVGPIPHKIAFLFDCNTEWIDLDRHSQLPLLPVSHLKTTDRCVPRAFTLAWCMDRRTAPPRPCHPWDSPQSPSSRSQIVRAHRHQAPQRPYPPSKKPHDAPMRVRRASAYCAPACVAASTACCANANQSSNWSDADWVEFPVFTWDELALPLKYAMRCVLPAVTYVSRPEP